jgi:16S rRNA G966 N2-methylase RsmD
MTQTKAAHRSFAGLRKDAGAVETGRSPVGADVKLAWAGRSFEPGAFKHAGANSESPFVVEERAAEEGVLPLDPSVRIIRGDALSIAQGLHTEGLSGQVDLVYVDPPYASERSWALEARLDGPADGRVRRHVAYDDKLETSAYLEMLAPRLDALASLLAPTATIWVHLDWRSAYLVRVVLDEILGREAFLNEIVWRRAPNLGRQAASQQFGRTLDTILVYGARDGSKGGRGTRAVLVPPTRLEPIDAAAIRWDGPPEQGGRPFTTAPRGDYTDASIARLEAEGRVHRTPSGKVYIKYFLVKDEGGRWCRERRVDALWTDVPPLRHAPVGERTGFPTQKPRALLDRIIGCATKQGGLVVDLFAGSGTTGEAAHALGRRAILGDAGDVGIATARARLLRAGARLSLERCDGAAPAVGGEMRVACEPLDAARLRVTLLEPDEPLAWAVDPAPREGRPFSSVRHSERVPGAKSRPVARELVIPRASEPDAPIAVRVFTDEGAVATQTFSPRRPRA